VIFGGKFTSPKAIIQTAKDQLETFNSVESQRATTSSLSRRTDTSCWKPPPMGVLKSNWDAAVDGRGKRIGIGVIVRDHDGGAMAMLSETQTMDFIQDPATAEALAARRAAELSLSLGIRKLILEGDSLQIVRAIQEPTGGQHMYGLIIEDTKILLRGTTDCKVEFVPREANGEAHKLAKLALLMGENKVWREDFPRL
jgi:hypothetical protein